MDLKANSGFVAASPKDQSPISAAKIAAAHNAQMEAKVAAVRADHDAKVAELVADLQGTRGEKEKSDTELAYLKASTRKERLLWNSERAILTRKVAEAEARARETADGVASPQEFVALQKGLATRDEIIQGLRKSVMAQESACERLQFELECNSTGEEDLDRLMVRVASLEQALAEETDARKTAQQLAEAASAENRSLERRLSTALAAAFRAEGEAATCAEDAATALEDVREARASQRHAELWLEKSLAEVDAVHAILEYSDRAAVAAATAAAAGPVPLSAMVGPSAQTPNPPSPDFVRIRVNSGDTGVQNNIVIGPGAQTPHPPSPAALRRGGGDSTAEGSPMIGARGHRTFSNDDSQGSALRTPDALDVTMPLLFSASTRLRSREDVKSGRKGGWKAEENDTTTLPHRGLEERVDGDGGRRGRCDTLSPPTPTVLFDDMTMEGGGKPSFNTVSRYGNGSVSSSYDKIYLPLKGENGGKSKTDTTTVEARSGESGLTLYHAPPSNGLRGGFCESHGHFDAENKAQHVANGSKLHTGTNKSKTTSMLVWLAFLLRYEMRRREKAEARASELETSLKTALQEAADTACRPRENGNLANENEHRSRSGSTVSVAEKKDCCCGACGGGGHHSMALPGETCTSISGVTADCYAHFARVDAERQKGKILEMVREAQARMGLSEPENSWNAGWRFSSRMEVVPGGNLPVEKRSRTIEEGENPSDEVASLIQQFETTLTHSRDANAQLRDFCTHLEGLLAGHGHKRMGGNQVLRATGIRSGHSSMKDNPTMTSIRSWKGASGSSMHDGRKSGGFSVSPMSMRGSPLPRPYQELC